MIEYDSTKKHTLIAEFEPPKNQNNTANKNTNDGHYGKNHTSRAGLLTLSPSLCPDKAVSSLQMITKITGVTVAGIISPCSRVWTTWVQTQPGLKLNLGSNLIYDTGLCCRCMFTADFKLISS